MVSPIMVFGRCIFPFSRGIPPNNHRQTDLPSNPVGPNKNLTGIWSENERCYSELHVLDLFVLLTSNL